MTRPALHLARAALGRVACLCGSHAMKPYRRLTRDSREWRCTRTGCGHQVADVHEAYVPWMFRGANPWGGRDGIGEALLRRGAEEGVDQRPWTPPARP